jgi:pilus assembly protein CpaC
MKPATFLIRPLAVLIAVACVSTGAYGLQTKAPQPVASSSPCEQVEMGPIVKLAVGKAALLKLNSPVKRVLLGNPEGVQAAQPKELAPGTDASQEANQQRNARRPGVADVDVLLLSPREVYLLGKTMGSTNIALLDRAGKCTLMDVAVGIDTVALNASLKEFMPGENLIKISSAADAVVLSGTVSDAAAADRVVDIAGAYVRRVSGGQAGSRASANDNVINMLSVAAPQQVMLEVKVAEVSKALLDEFGIDVARAYASADGNTLRFLSGIFGGKSLLGGHVGGVGGAKVGGGLAGAISNGSGLSAVTSPFGSVEVTNGAVTKGTIAAGTNATIVGVDAQKQDGLVKVLAEPTVMAISGQEGSFLAGGKIFIPVASNNASGGTSITLEEKEFGVSLKFTPTVLGDGRINLKVSPEVSELNPQGVTITSTNIAGTSILPSFTTRRASTTVQLRDGQSFAIGGLIKNNTKASISAFPFLGELPILGALFRSTSFQSDRTELVFVITPRLVKPLPPDYALPTDGFIDPSRSDMILNGRLEGGDGKAAQKPVAVAEPQPAVPAPPASATSGFEVK